MVKGISLEKFFMSELGELETKTTAGKPAVFLSPEAALSTLPPPKTSQEGKRRNEAIGLVELLFNAALTAKEAPHLLSLKDRYLFSTHLSETARIFLDEALTLDREAVQAAIFP